MLDQIQKLVNRSQRGIKIKDGDMFLRSGRLFIVVDSAPSEMVVMEPATGKKKSMSASEFKSKHIQRVKVSDGAKSSVVDTAREVLSSVSMGDTAKSAILTALQRSSGKEDSLKIKEMIGQIWSAVSKGGRRD